MGNDSHLIAKILAESRTIAVVGFSSSPERPGYYVPEYLQQHGYRIIPVNPALTSALGEPAYASLLEIPEAVDVVLIFRRSEAVPPFVEQALAIGAKTVWMQLGVSHPAAAEQARRAGLQVVMNACLSAEHRYRNR